MILKPEISIGDILTIISIMVSVIALLISWQRNQELKRKEYADKIRRGASTVIVKILRWRDLTLRFFEDIQPLITEADIEIVKSRKVSAVRDTFWQNVSDVRTKVSQRIIDEQVETAYIDLYGFDPRILTLFSEVSNRLKAIDKSIYTQTLYSTQADILSFQSQSAQITSSQLGNKLRNTCYLIIEECQRLMNEAIEPFSDEMIRLIDQNDLRIVRRKFKTLSVADLYPVSLNQLQVNLDEQVKKNLSQIAKVTVAGVKPKVSVASSLLVPVIPANQEMIGSFSLDTPHHDIYSKEMEKEIATITAFANMAKAINQNKDINRLDQQSKDHFNQISSSKKKRKRR